MTFEQLNYFISVVENDTYFDAAYCMNISQSSLSKQIMKLEKELDMALFDRSSRSATLTEAGEFFYHEAKELVKHYNETLERVKSFKTSKEKNLHIAVLPIQTQYNLNSFFNGFKNKFPDINLTISEVEDDRLIEGVQKNEYDLMIAREAMFDSDEFDMYPVAEDELVVVLSSNHELANCPQLTFEQIADEKFILMNPYTSINKLCMEHLEKHKINANIIRTARTESIIGSVSINEGISLMPKGNFEVFNQRNIATVPLDPPIKLSVVLAKNKNVKANEAAKKFIKYIKD